MHNIHKFWFCITIKPLYVSGHLSFSNQRIKQLGLVDWHLHNFFKVLQYILIFSTFSKALLNMVVKWQNPVFSLCQLKNHCLASTSSETVLDVIHRRTDCNIFFPYIAHTKPSTTWMSSSVIASQSCNFENTCWTLSFFSRGFINLTLPFQLNGAV